MGNGVSVAVGSSVDVLVGVDSGTLVALGWGVGAGVQAVRRRNDEMTSIEIFLK